MNGFTISIGYTTISRLFIPNESWYIKCVTSSYVTLWVPDWTLLKTEDPFGGGKSMVCPQTDSVTDIPYTDVTVVYGRWFPDTSGDVMSTMESLTSVLGVPSSLGKVVLEDYLEVLNHGTLCFSYWRPQSFWVQRSGQSGWLISKVNSVRWIELGVKVIDILPSFLWKKYSDNTNSFPYPSRFDFHQSTVT